MKLPRALASWATLPSHWQRRTLWTVLAVLVIALHVTLVWLAGRYETSQVQTRMERDAVDAVSDLRANLVRNLQSVQALQYGNPTPRNWTNAANILLRDRRELVRIEWRHVDFHIQAYAETPYRPAIFARLGRDSMLSEIQLACATANRLSGPAYARSSFVPMADGVGIEVMDLCFPVATAGVVQGYVIVTYSLQGLLEELSSQLTRSQEVSFTEGDGTRLAVRGARQRGSRAFTAQHLLDLPGNTLVLRMDAWRADPGLFPNVLTALVTAMSVALIAILLLLGRDMRRRLKAEGDLADALAFRKAMEDSLITGLRARDREGHITYVNPAFCQMVGYSAEELLGLSGNFPYWPPEFAAEYRTRQAIRLAGDQPPREGYESVFMHKDGTRFPVLIIEAPLINAQGLQTGWMSTCLDIREQRRVEDLSRASQERLQATARLAMVGEMASLLSHELNQPLAAISSYATGTLNLLEHDAQSSMASDIAMAMRRIAEQAERAGKVIKSVHDFVRRRDQTREAVAPSVLIDAIQPLVQLQAHKLAVKFQLVMEPDLPAVFCDRTMVEQALLNLARNGMQAMDQAGAPQRLLKVQVRRSLVESRRVEFSVADWGPGISDEVAAQLFTPFFTTKAEGMGLGLSLCRTVAEQHGGTLVYAPNQPQGIIFSFTLPMAPNA